MLDSNPVRTAMEAPANASYSKLWGTWNQNTSLPNVPQADYDEIRTSNTGAFLQDGAGNGKDYFYAISNIRAEFASLNYGAALTIQYCLEAPFAYKDISTVGSHDGDYEYGEGNKTESWIIRGHCG